MSYFSSLKAHNLPPELLRKREVIVVDIANDSVSNSVN
jgi:hypothetical protein